jgi:murein DD-endopeptidase MepM/ murein hydrolase activator NlpD
MSRERFYFDPVTHRFEPCKPTLKVRLKRYSLYALLAIILSVFIRFASHHFLSNPKEARLLAAKETILERYKTTEERIKELEAVMLDIQHWDDHIYRTFFELEPIPHSIREAGLGGTERYPNLQGYETSPLMVDLNQRADLTGIRMDIQSRSFGDLLQEADRHNRLMLHKPSIQPVSLQDFYWISSVFGYRTDPVYKHRAMHYGVDFAAEIGTPVYATGDGVVKWTRVSSNGYGRVVAIDHGFGILTLYGHLHEIMVHTGQKIKRGNVLGTIGETGKSTGPHLHYEVREKGRAVNPKHFYAEDLTPEQYSEIINLSGKVNN